MAIIPAPVYRVINLLRGPHPLAAVLGARVNRMVVSDINGSRGTVRIGENASRKFTGYAQSPQNFRGMPTRGAAPGGAFRGGMGSGLPGTQAPVGEPNPLLDAIARTQNPITGGKK